MPKDGDKNANNTNDKKVENTSTTISCSTTSNSNEPKEATVSFTETTPVQTVSNNEPVHEVKALNNCSSNDLIIETKEPNNESLEHIRKAQQQLAAIKDAIKKLIHAMGTNPSYIEKAAQYWSTVSTPGKILSGTALTASPTLVGLGAGTVVATSAVPVVAAIVGTSTFFLSASYIFSGYILSNHSQNHEEFVNKIKDGILSLAEILTLIIEKLGVISHDLTLQMDAFEQQNAKLTNHVNYLVEQLSELTTQISIFKETEAHLKSVTLSLEEETMGLKLQGEKDEELLKKQEAELAETKIAHKKINDLLEAKILEVDIIKKSLGLELEKAKKTSTLYKNAVQSMTTTCQKNEEDRTFFKEKLDGIANKAEADFSNFQKNLVETEKQFSNALEKLHKGNEIHEELLKKEAMALNTLNNMLNPEVKPESETNNTAKDSWIGSIGFYRRAAPTTNTPPTPKSAVSYQNT